MFAQRRWITYESEVILLREHASKQHPTDVLCLGTHTQCYAGLCHWACQGQAGICAALCFSMMSCVDNQTRGSHSGCSSEQSCCFLATGVAQFTCRLSTCSTAQLSCMFFPSTNQNKGWKSLILVYLLAIEELFNDWFLYWRYKKNNKELQEMGTGLCPVPALAPLLRVAELPAEVMVAVNSWGQCAAAPFFPFSLFPSCPDVAFWLLPLFWSKLSQHCQKHLWWVKFWHKVRSVRELQPASIQQPWPPTEEVSPQPCRFQTLANSTQCNPRSCHLRWRITPHPVDCWWR